MHLKQLEGEAGRGVLLSRIADRRGAWLSLKEASTTLLPARPQQSFKNQLHRCSAEQRPATEEEKDFLCLHGAIRTRSSNASLVHVKGVCAAVSKMSLDSTLVANIASIPDLPAYSHHENKLPNPAAALIGLQGLSESLRLCALFA